LFLPAADILPINRSVLYSSFLAYTRAHSQKTPSAMKRDRFDQIHFSTKLHNMAVSTLAFPTGFSSFFSQLFQADGGIVSHIKPQTLPSASLSTHYAFSTPSFDDVRTWTKN